MTRRIVLVLTGVAAAGLLAAGCGDGSSESVETRRDATAMRADAPREGGEGAEVADLAVAEFTVEGMTCGGCALATEMAVRKLDAVASADAEYDESTGEGSCMVKYDPSLVSTDSIARAIRGAGFEPRLRKGGAP